MKKGNTCTPLLGMQIDASTIGNSIEASQKIKSRSTMWSGNPTSWFITKEMKAITWQDISIPMFVAALFAIAMIWKHCKSVDRWMDKKCDIYNIDIEI